MPYQPNDLLSRHFQESSPDLISQVEEQLNRVSTSSPNIPHLPRHDPDCAAHGQEDHNRWNAKITLQALRELEQTFRVLEQFKRRRKVTVFGSARTPVEHPLYALAGTRRGFAEFGHDGHHRCRWRHLTHGRRP